MAEDSREAVEPDGITLVGVEIIGSYEPDTRFVITDANGDPVTVTCTGSFSG